MSFRSRRGGTGVELLSAMMFANLVGAWTWSETDGLGSAPSSYATEGSKPPTAGVLTDATDLSVTFDTTNTVPGKGNTCSGSKTGCTTGGETEAVFGWGPEGGYMLEVEVNAEHLVLSRDVLFPPADESDLTLSFTSDDDPDHFTTTYPNIGTAELLAHDHTGGADVHCLGVTAEEAAELLAETGLPVCGSFSTQFWGQDDAGRPFDGEGRIERIGRNVEVNAEHMVACVAYGDADGEVLSVTVTGTGGSLTFMDYTDDACM